MAAVTNVASADTGEDLSSLINNTAQQHGLPPELFLALAIAESELNVRSERWGRHTAEARAALTAGDRPGLEAIVAAIESETPGDISFGLFQQTVRWAQEGDHSSSLGNILAIRDLYWNPSHAAEVAARQLAGHVRRFGDPLESLCRYNWPAVAGVENPHRARYLESLERARGFLSSSGAEQPAVDVLSGYPLETRLSPNVQPGRGQTVGIVIHSTRGGKESAEGDYQATINHFLNPRSEVSAHLVIGPSAVCRMVPDDDVAWHSRENNRTHLGIEIAQPSLDSPYNDFQYRATAAIVRDWCARYGVPKEHVASQAQPGIIGHDETEQGKSIGKSDPGPKFDWDYFMRLVGGASPAVQPPGPVLGDGFRAFLAEHPEAGQPRHDEASDLYGNTYMWLAATDAYPRGALLIWRKWLNRVKLTPWEEGHAELMVGTIGEYLAAHPDVGAPRHEEQTDVFNNRYVWLSACPAHPLGALLMWRQWINSVQLIAWEEARVTPAVGTTPTQGSGTDPIQSVTAQCQVLRANYDSEEDYLLWAGPRSGGVFETASCSAAAMAAVLTAYGRPTNISGAIRILGPSRISTEVGLLDASLEGMRQAIEPLGLAAERGYLSYDELLSWLAEGPPVILDLPGMFGGMGHILVAISGDAAGCELADSARRERPRWRASREELEGYSRRPDRKLAGLRMPPKR